MDVYKKKINLFLINLEKDLETIKTLEQLKILKSKYSNLEELKTLKQELKNSKDLNIKKQIGEILNFYNLKLLNEIAEKKVILENNNYSSLTKNELLDDLQISLDTFKSKGKLHPLTIFSNKVKQFFSLYNYQFIYGFEIEEERYNFDILNIPNYHPARAMQDSFYFTNGKMLRTHSTNVTARELSKSLDLNNFFYSIGTVFRNDDNDATHSFQFNQIDLFSTSEQMLSISDLKTLIDSLLGFIFENNNLKTRYRISYFPFTEPSFEVDIWFEKNQESRWIEVLGCGMINEKVLENTNKNPLKINGFAAGLGVERLSMLKWNISDIRNFYLNDIKFLNGIEEL